MGEFCEIGSVPLPNITWLTDGIMAFGQSYVEVHQYVATILCVVGTLMNLATVVVLTRPSMISPVNVLLCAVAVCDIFVMTSYLVFIVHFHLVAQNRCQQSDYSYGWGMFTMVHAHVSVIFHATSIWLTVSLAQIRVLTIRRATAGPTTQITEKFSVILAVVTLIIMAAVNLPNFMTFEIDEIPAEYFMSCLVGEDDDFDSIIANSSRMVYTLRAHEKDCMKLKMAFWSNGMIFKVVPCLLLTVSIVALLKIIADVSNKRKNLAQVMKKKVPKDHTTPMLVAVLSIFLIAELPQGVMLVMTGIFSSDTFKKTIYQPLGDFMDFLSLLNSAIGFFIYVGMSRKFRSVFFQLFFSVVHCTPYSSTKYTLSRRSARPRHKRHLRHHIPSNRTLRQPNRRRSDGDQHIGGVDAVRAVASQVFKTISATKSGTSTTDSRFHPVGVLIDPAHRANSIVADTTKANNGLLLQVPVERVRRPSISATAPLAPPQPSKRSRFFEWASGKRKESFDNVEDESGIASFLGRHANLLFLNSAFLRPAWRRYTQQHNQQWWDKHEQHLHLQQMLHRRRSSIYYGASCDEYGPSTAFSQCPSSFGTDPSMSTFDYELLAARRRSSRLSGVGDGTWLKAGEVNKLHPNQNTRRSIQSASPNFLSVPGFNNNDSKRSSILSANEQISTQCSHAVLLPVPQLKTVKEQPNYRQRPYLQSAVNFVRKWFRTENLINLFAGSSHPSNSNENSSPQRRLQLQTETNYPGFVY